MQQVTCRITYELFGTITGQRPEAQKDEVKATS